MNYKKILIGLAAMALAVTATACGTVDKILKEVDNQNYDEALDIYDAKDLKDKEYDKLSEELETRINGYVDAYAQNEIEYAQLEELINFANEMKMPEMTEYLAQVSIDVYDLKNSKENYQRGLDYLAEETFDSAYQCFDAVIEKDGYYQDAQTQKENTLKAYCEAVQTHVDELVKAENYEDALYYLQQTKSRVYFSDDLTARITGMEEKTRKAYIIKQADQLVKENDIAGALTKIAEAKEEYKFSDTSDLDAYVDDISDEYVDTIMTTVNNARDEENYILALKILRDAQQIVDNEQFAKAIEEIEKIKPTYLYDLKCSASNRFEVLDSGDPQTDSVGNVYDVGNLFSLSASSGWSSDVASAEFNVGYKYGLMTGVIATNDTTDNDAKATLKIEGDGEVLFSQQLSKTTEPVPFSVDLSKYNWLKISLVEPEGGSLNALLIDCKFGKPNEQPATEAASEGETDTESATEETAPATEAETEAKDEETTAAESSSEA